MVYGTENERRNCIVEKRRRKRSMTPPSSVTNSSFCLPRLITRTTNLTNTTSIIITRRIVIAGESGHTSIIINRPSLNPIVLRMRECRFVRPISIYLSILKMMILLWINIIRSSSHTTRKSIVTAQQWSLRFIYLELTWITVWIICRKWKNSEKQIVQWAGGWYKRLNGTGTL